MIFSYGPFCWRTLYRKREVYAPEKECIIANKHKQGGYIMTMHGHRSARRGNQMRSCMIRTKRNRGRERKLQGKRWKSIGEKERAGGRARKYEPKRERLEPARAGKYKEGRPGPPFLVRREKSRIRKCLPGSRRFCAHNGRTGISTVVRGYIVGIAGCDAERRGI